MSKAADLLQNELKKVESLENDLEMLLTAFSNLIQSEQKRFEQKIVQTAGMRKGALEETGKKIASLIEDHRRTREELATLQLERKKEYAKWMANFRKQEEKVFRLEGEKLQLQEELNLSDVQAKALAEKDRQIERLQAEVKKLQGKVGSERFEMDNLRTELEVIRKREKESATEIERLKNLANGHYRMLDEKQKEIVEKERAYKRLANHLGEIQKLSFDLKTSTQAKERDLYKYRNELNDRSAQLETIKTRNDELSHLLLKHKERIAQLLEYNREQNRKVEQLYKELCEERGRGNRLQAEIGALKTRSLYWEEGASEKKARRNEIPKGHDLIDDLGLEFDEADADPGSSDRSIF